jgi:hypothetical protein
MNPVAKSLMGVLLFGAVAAVTTMRSGSARAKQATVPTVQNDVTAIDILLDPDATMIQHATAAFMHRTSPC